MAWLEPNRVSWAPWGEMFWLWLSARYAGIQAAKYVGAITGLQDVGWWGGGCWGSIRGSTFQHNVTRLRLRCGQLKPEPVMHICALFHSCSILLRYVQRATNKAQFHLVPISPLFTTLPSFLPPCREPVWTLERMQRCRSYIEVAFLCNPHRADDRILLKRERLAGGDFKSEEDIRKIHWK